MEKSYDQLEIVIPPLSFGLVLMFSTQRGGRNAVLFVFTLVHAAEFTSTSDPTHYTSICRGNTDGDMEMQLSTHDDTTFASTNTVVDRKAKCMRIMNTWIV
ncbi:hypothetical protein ILYODFUR_037870 [Ilyodon furcidens]|uniref:Uncharacterized protein n=1 Tax=Ilyodon furcidens TaxID=33524 RepID=A0ABV0T786_9TELE